MNGFTEPLPGLLDDPQFQILNLPSLPDVHIAPLRNPAPSRHPNAPLPLEPLTTSSEDHRHGTRNSTQFEDEPEKLSQTILRPSDVLSAREAKKPHLAISELLETSNDVEMQHLPLPSFVSLAVVEKSPVQQVSHLSPHKRLRLDLDVDVPSPEVGRRLPRPAQKDDKQPRPVPLLPAMVTGLHEPPPSAGILPSMDLDGRPHSIRTSKASKMQVKDILAEAKRSSTHVPPEAMLNTPDLPPAELPKPRPDPSQPSDVTKEVDMLDTSNASMKKDLKTRRARRKWSDEETAALLTGVKKYGFGKWKQILNDTAYTFHNRTSIDLKDRYRVYVKDQPDTQASTLPQQNSLQSTASSQEQEPGQGGETSNPTIENTETSKTKRKRRPWTHTEDVALLQGVSKYGFQWTLIHDDPDLDLSHRRATDLRDRIRNLYPEGYKQAEARPSKSEMKKNHDHELGSADSKAKITANDNRAVAKSSQEAGPGTNSGSSQSKSRLSRAKAHKSGGDPHQSAEHMGVTLPPLDLDDDDELDWGNNTLPPLLEWEEIGM